VGGTSRVGSGADPSRDTLHAGLPVRSYRRGARGDAQLTNALLGFGLGTAVQRAHAGERGEDDSRRLVTLAIVLVVIVGGVVYGTGRWWCPLVGLGPFSPVIQYAVILGGFDSGHRAAAQPCPQP
jgi:hypothetical protein